MIFKVSQWNQWRYFPPLAHIQEWLLITNDRGWDGWMASPTRWTWVWASSGSWWRTGKPDMLQSMQSQKVGHDWATELNWFITIRERECLELFLSLFSCLIHMTTDIFYSHLKGDGKGRSLSKMLTFNSLNSIWIVYRRHNGIYLRHLSLWLGPLPILLKGNNWKSSDLRKDSLFSPQCLILCYIPERPKLLNYHYLNLLSSSVTQRHFV